MAIKSNTYQLVHWSYDHRNISEVNFCGMAKIILGLANNSHHLCHIPSDHNHHRHHNHHNHCCNHCHIPHGNMDHGLLCFWSPWNHHGHTHHHNHHIHPNNHIPCHHNPVFHNLHVPHHHHDPLACLLACMDH